MPDGLHPQVNQVGAAGELERGLISTEASTMAPTPRATAIACTSRPPVLPSTVNKAPRRPTLSARPTVNNALGPGMRSRTNAVTANATSSIVCLWHRTSVWATVSAPCRTLGFGRVGRSTKLG